MNKSHLLKRLKKTCVWALRIFGATLALLVVIALLLNIPAVQTAITARISQFVSEKTKSEFKVGAVKIALPKTVHLSDVFIADQQQDTLLFLGSLKINVELMQLLRQELRVKTISLDDLVANVKREPDNQNFNYQFIVDAFATGDETDDTKPADNSSSWKINVKTINLNGLHILFRDDYEELEAKLSLGEFSIHFNAFDLENLDFDIKEIFLKNSSATYSQWIDREIEKELDLGSLNLSNSNFTIKTAVVEPDSISFEKQITENLPATLADFLPDWKIRMNELLLTEIGISYQVGKNDTIISGFNPKHVVLQDIMLDLRGIEMSPEGVTLELRNLSAADHSGFVIDKMAFGVAVDNQGIILDDLTFLSGKTNLLAKARLNYQSIGALIGNTGETGLHFTISNTQFDMQDFLPHFVDIIPEQFHDLSLDVAMEMMGKIDDLNVETFQVALPGETRLTATARLQGLPVAENLAFDLKVEPLFIRSIEVIHYLDPALLAGLDLPDEMQLDLSAKGTMDSVDARFSLNTTYGNLVAEAYYFDTKQLRDTFNLKLIVDALELEKLLANESLGSLSLELDAWGSGATSDSISAGVTGNVVQAVFNDYVYEKFLFTGKLNHEQLVASINSDDPNLDFSLHLMAGLHEQKQTFELEADLRQMDFKAMNFAQERLETKANIKAGGHYVSMDDMAVHFEMRQSQIIREALLIPVENILLDVLFSENESRLDLTSEIADLNLTGNLSPAKMGVALQNAWNVYLGKSSSQQLPEDIVIDFQVVFHPDNDILLQLIPDLQTLQINTLKGGYKSSGNQLTTGIQLPLLVWRDIKIEDFYLELNGLEDALDFSVGFDQLIYDTIGFGNFSVTEKIKSGEITSTIAIKETNGQPAYHFKNAVVVENDRIKLSFLPDGLIIDGKQWHVPDNHSIEIIEDRISAHNFSFTLGEQLLAFDTPEKVHRLTTENFDLNNWINLLNFSGDKRLIGGNLNTDLEITGNEDKTVVSIDAFIENFQFIDSLIGNISLSAKQIEDLWLLDFELQHTASEIKVTGKLDMEGEEPVFDLSCKLKISELGLFEPFTFGEITRLQGALSGEVLLSGTAGNPFVSGALNFKEASMNVRQFNFLTLLKDETVRFDRRGIHLENFTVRDENLRELVINGSVFTPNYNDFRFDLGINTDRFQPVNSTSSDNELLYGALFLGTDTQITGTAELPVIRSQLLIDRGTDMTYVLPGSEIELITPEGVVRFDIQGQDVDEADVPGRGDYLTDSIISAISGVDMSVNLRLHPEAKFTVIIDPVSGDYLSIGGEAILNFTLDQAGNQALTGVFEVNEGFYQLSFYGLVKKSFSFEPGSNISWSGDIMDANINFTAKHIVRTSSEELMANETVGMSHSERNIFRQRLPYEVLLHIRGFLSEPEVSFNIRLPERYLVNYPQIASKLNMLNSEHSETELNKQVFALLVIGGFMPAGGGSGGSGATGIATTAARNSVNGILTQQMNNLSDRYIRGFDVEFDLQSYEDFSGGTGETRTELDVQVSRSFLNERLTVEASGTFDLEGERSKSQGQPSQQMYGEFAVIYDITESGELRLKAYRENAWDIFDGEVVNSGVAFIIQKSFNQWTRKKSEDQSTTTEKLTFPKKEEHEEW
jgi:hypothetical protein